MLIVDCWWLTVDCWLLMVDCWLLMVDCCAVNWPAQVGSHTFLHLVRCLPTPVCVCVCHKWSGMAFFGNGKNQLIKMAEEDTHRPKISQQQWEDIKISPPHQESPRWFRHHSARLPHVAPDEIFNVASTVPLFSVFPSGTSSREIVMNFKTRRLTEEATAESPQRRKQKLKMILKKNAAA